MSWYDEPATRVAAPEPARTPGWPLYMVIGLSGAGLLVAVSLRSYLTSVICYGALLIVGCGLLFYHRRLAIAATRRAGGIGYLAISGRERGAVAALAAACLANGLVIAFELATWDWGF